MFHFLFQRSLRAWPLITNRTSRSSTKWAALLLLLQTNRQMASLPPTYTVVFVRHGQSEWNKKNQFCGWYDAHLSEKGREEARTGGRNLKKRKFIFDTAYSSVLSRSVETLEIVLEEMGLKGKIPHIKQWRLNERHYGNLTGLNKLETVKKYGEKQVHLWRRSFDVRPPDITPQNAYYEQIVTDPRYAKIGGGNVPLAESLKDTIARVLPFWNDVIVPEVINGKRVIISAHGNSLRSIVKYLDDISDEAISSLNLPTGIPFVYVLDEKMKPVPGKSMQFVGDAATVRKAMEAVQNQTKTTK